MEAYCYKQPKTHIRIIHYDNNDLAKIQNIAYFTGI